MAKTQTPTLSVVMPVYNASKYLEETVRSVLAQTFTDFELIAVDDKSTDDSLAILQKLAKEDSRINVVSQAKNGGAAIATNAAKAKARGR